MSTQRLSMKWKYFLGGFVLAFSILILMGAYRETPGRYQLNAWGASNIGFGAFVTDTASGETKIVYLNTGTVKENNLGKAFEAFKAESAKGEVLRERQTIP